MQGVAATTFIYSVSRTSGSNSLADNHGSVVMLSGIEWPNISPHFKSLQLREDVTTLVVGLALLCCCASKFDDIIYSG